MTPPPCPTTIPNTTRELIAFVGVAVVADTDNALANEDDADDG